LSAICGVISNLVEVLADRVEIAQLDARKLQIRTGVEVSETFETEPPDLVGGQLASGALDLAGDLLNKFVDLRASHWPLVGCSLQSAA
jgi:hypothetical protein